MPLFDESCSRCKTTKERYYAKFKKKPDPCDACGGKVDRHVSGATFHDFNRIMKTSDAQPYVTTNIHPEGKPIEIRSHGQLQRECKKYGVVHAPEKNPM